MPRYKNKSYRVKLDEQNKQFGNPWLKMTQAIKDVQRNGEVPGVKLIQRFKVPINTEVILPPPGSRIPPKTTEWRHGQMIRSIREVIYNTDEHLQSTDDHFIFKVDQNDRNIPYIVVGKKDTIIVWILELSGDMNEEIF